MLEHPTKDNIDAMMAELNAILTRNASREFWNDLDDSNLRNLLTVLIRIYGSKIKAGKELDPVDSVLNQTETSIFVDRLLTLKNVELFEIQMWRSIGAKY